MMRYLRLCIFAVVCMVLFSVAVGAAPASLIPNGTFDTDVSGLGYTVLGHVLAQRR